MTAHRIGEHASKAMAGELSSARLERLACEAIRLARAAATVHLARTVLGAEAVVEAADASPSHMLEGAAT